MASDPRPDRFAVVTGDPFGEGLRLYGCFDSIERATEWADTIVTDRVYWVVPIRHPEED